MDSNTHKVAGIYVRREDAEAARAAARAAGFEDRQMDMIDRMKAIELSLGSEVRDEDKTFGAAKDILTGATVGAAAVGAAGAAAAAIGLFVAPPVAAGLASAGLGGLIGGFVGGAAAPSVRESEFLELVREATRQGHWVLVLNADSQAQALEAQDVISNTVAEATVDQYGSQQPHTIGRS